MTASVPARAVEVWVEIVAPLVGVGMVIWLGAIVGWPGWWVSLMVVTALAAIVYLAVGHGPVGPTSGRPRLLVTAMCMAVVAASAGTVVAAAVHRHADRALVADRAEVRRVSGELICRLLTTGTDADRAAARSSATGELGARLQSGSAAVDTTTPTAGRADGTGTTTRCAPVRTGLGAVSTDDADVVVAANLTERAGSQESASGRVIAAHLERVGGSWKVATLDLVR